MDFINKFDVLLLDVGHTFVFWGYRFFYTEDFAATYRSLGGNLLQDELVNKIVFIVNYLATGSRGYTSKTGLRGLESFKFRIYVKPPFIRGVGGITTAAIVNLSLLLRKS